MRDILDGLSVVGYMLTYLVKEFWIYIATAISVGLVVWGFSAMLDVAAGVSNV